MRNPKFIGLFAILIMVGISNYFSAYINVYTEGIGKQYHFESESGDFECNVIPSKSRDVDLMIRQYENHLQQAGTQKETLYRTFKPNPLKIWNWYRYLNNPLYQYEYKRSRQR